MNSSGRRFLLSIGTSVFDPTLVRAADSGSSGQALAAGLDWYVKRAEVAGLSSSQILFSTPVPDAELWAAIVGRADRLAQRLKAGQRTTAELATLRKIEPFICANDELVLFASDNWPGTIAARIVGEVAKRTWGPRLRVRHRLVEGLDVERPARFEAACVRLLRMASEEIRRAANPVIVATGGYKIMIAYLNLAGLLFGALVVYLHEKSEAVHCLPRVALTPDLSVWNHHFSVFARLSTQSSQVPGMSADRFRSLSAADVAEGELEPFVTHEEGLVRLSPLGQVLHERAMEMHRDELTGLYRRSFFEQALGPWLKRRATHRCGLIVVDIDNFKQVNDSYGHESGDLVLVETAQRLQTLAAAHQAWPLRWGGEEFLVIAPQFGLSETATLAERMRVAVAQRPITLPPGTAVPITVTCGVAAWPDSYASSKRLTDDFDKVLDLADQAMLEGKRSSRNCVEVAKT